MAEEDKTNVDPPEKLLSSLPRIELKEKKGIEKGGELQFERNILSAAGLTQNREVELIQDLVGKERWDKDTKPPEETAEKNSE